MIGLVCGWMGGYIGELHDGYIYGRTDRWIRG